jgi:YidC/Oxa1 family membrane protein insertase
MDRKAIIAVSLAFLVLLVWNAKFAPKAPQLPKPATAVTTGTNSAATAPDAVIAQAPGSTGAAPSTPTESGVAENTDKVATPSVEYAFTNLGGGISRATLLKHQAEKGSNVALNEFGTLPIGAISEKAGEGATLPYKISHDAQTGEVLCERTGSNGVQILKKFTLPQSGKDTEEYLVRLDVSFTNQGAQPYQSPGFFIYAGSAAPVHPRDLPNYTAFDWYRLGKAHYIDVNWFAAGKLPFVGVQTHPERPFYSETADNIQWAGVRSQYFATLITPNEAKGNSIWAHRFPVDLETRLRATGSSSLYPFAVEGALGMPGFTVQPGQTFTQSFSIYAGPKVYKVLKKLGQDQDEIMNFGMFAIVSKFLLSSMNKLHSLTGSYAFAIVLLTICIRIVLWPLQNRATQSMKQMQQLQPKMTELREKYKDDPTRMNQELMKLYKDYHVNPVSGCLPMFVQIPVFFGFYSMLGTSIELRGSGGGILFWVHDLSQPDTIFRLGTIPVNILPLCMAITMLVQMQLTPKSGDRTQQKVFMFVPLIFVVFCYNYASALALYWTVQNLFSIVQLYVTRNKMVPALHKETPTKKRK